MNIDLNGINPLKSLGNNLRIGPSHLRKDQQCSKEHLNPNTPRLILKLTLHLIIANKQAHQQLPINRKQHPNGAQNHPHKLFPGNLDPINLIIHNENKQRPRAIQRLYNRLCQVELDDCVGDALERYDQVAEEQHAEVVGRLVRDVDVEVPRD